MDYYKAKELLVNGCPSECMDFFKNNGYLLEYGYSLLLSRNLNKAVSVFNNVNSNRADWAKKIISIINDSIDAYPTFFQIRSFLEIDLNLFFNSGNIDYINKILLISNILQQINNESYKFLGRVLLKNDCTNEAKIFLDRSLDSYYNDVELHYLYVEYYLYNNDIDNAKKAVLNCLKINPEYYPAKKTKELLTK